jgi:hypothetical protein
MIQKIAIIIFLNVMCLNAKSQDTIILKNGLTVYGLITDISNGDIKFRIDGGAVQLSEVKTYIRGGQEVLVNNTPISEANMPKAAPVECEIKNIGDVQFENKMKKDAVIYIYAIGIQPQGSLSESPNNPLITTITVPANGSASAYDLTTGVHYIYISIEGTIFPKQIKIKKCQTIKESLNINQW